MSLLTAEIYNRSYVVSDISYAFKLKINKMEIQQDALSLLQCDENNRYLLNFCYYGMIQA